MFDDKKLPNSEKLELIYDLHSVCEALIHDGFEAASALFVKRVRQVSALSHGSISSEDAAIMLASLNMGLYNFFQFYIHASFTRCCHGNDLMSLENGAKTIDELIAAGNGILRAYRQAYASAQSECDHIERARNHIREHISDKLTLESVSSAINISPSYLSRIFSAFAGRTFCEYIRDERIALACKLLGTSNLSIDEVSERCGFSTPNYFSTVFKKCTGQAPAAYRMGANAHKKGQTVFSSGCSKTNV